ncbi:MAG: spore germination protein [Firmicutes bacterium]|nr:spore germination protein [Bacillota bacterium]
MNTLATAGTKKFSKKLEDNLEYIREKLGLDTNFDIILRQFKVGGKEIAAIFVDGFADGQTATLIFQTLLASKREEIIPNPLTKIMQERLPYIEIDTVDSLEETITQILSGPMVLFIDGEQEAIVIDTREYPARGPDEPDIEKITRGSRDGFVETMIFNIALIRRRLRDPGFRVEPLRVGKRSITDISLVYINDIVNPEILERIRKEIKAIDVDGLSMAEKSVEEFITKTFWNPFPKVRYTERPDVCAAHLLEGHVAIIVDTSPSVMIAPVTYFHHLQHAEEYRQSPLTGIYIRWVRLIGVLISFLLAPLWLLVSIQPEILPPSLSFIGPQEEMAIPLFIQFIIAHLGLDLLRLASVHTPSPLATALGLVGALLIGDIAVKVGLFSNEVLLYTALVAIGIFSTPSWELSQTNRLIMLFLLLTTGFFRLPGFILGIAAIFVLLIFTRSFGVPYLWPFIPLNFNALMAILFRRPVPIKGYRPAVLQPMDPDRSPPGEK